MASTMALMPVHSEWLEMLIRPSVLDRQYLASKNERNIFDLMVHLINNGLDLTIGAFAAAAAAAASNGQPSNDKEDQDYKLFVETKKLKTIRFLVFKLLSYFDWNLDKIIDTLPSKQQEFLFSEFRATFEASEWKTFANLMFNRWVQRLLLKQAYPSKPTRVLQFASNVSQNVIDPYYVAPETHENIMKRVHGHAQSTMPEVEKLLTDLERGQRSFDIIVPTFDCFVVDAHGELVYDFSKSLRPDRDSFLDDIYYDFGKWYFIKEDYERADRLFSKIKTSKPAYECLDGYRTASRIMTNDRYVVPEPKRAESNESCEKKVIRYINTIVKEMANFYDDDYVKLNPSRVATTLKKLADETRRSPNFFIYDRIIKYFLIKISSFGDDHVKQQCRDILLGGQHQQAKHGQEMEGVIEEGEIGEHEEAEEDLLLPLEGEDANELLLLNAIEPDQILALIGSIQRAPLAINRNWKLPANQTALVLPSMPAPEKCHILLAKANELRRAQHFEQSRALYRLLLEDNQATFNQNPRLSLTILHEILYTDLLTFFDLPNGEHAQRVAELDGRCVQYLATIDPLDKAYLGSTQLLELVCIFLISHAPVRLKEFSMLPCDIVQFSACLASAAETRERSKEFWDLMVYAFIPPPKQPQANGMPKIVFFSSLADFLKRLKKNKRAMMIAATALIKIFNSINDNPTHAIALCLAFDVFPPSIQPSLVNLMETKEVSWTIEEVLKVYLLEAQDVNLMKYYGDYLLLAGAPSDAMRWYVCIIAQSTCFFSTWDSFDLFEELVIGQMIKCATALNFHLLVAVLYQFQKEPDYGLAFKALAHFNGSDSGEDLLECMWDVTMLEYIINLSHRRALGEREAKVIALMQQLDLNSNNSEPVLKEAAALRKGRLMRMLARLYMP